MRKIVLGVLAGIVMVALLGATTGGFPSRPRFLSIGVNTAPPSTNGNIVTTGAITAASVDVGTAGSFNAKTYNVTDGTRVGFFQADSNAVSVGSQSAHPLRLYSHGTLECGIATAGSGFDCIDGFSVNGVALPAPTDMARLSTNNIFTGTTQQNSGTSPRWALEETDAAADEKCSFIISTGGVWRLYLSTDANCTSTTGATVALEIDRTGNSASSFQYKGSEVCRQDGVGCQVTMENGSFTGTFTGVTGCATETVTYNRTGNIVALEIPSTSCTSNATTYTMTGVPAQLQPTSTTGVMPIARCDNNGATENGTCSAQKSGGNGTVTFLRNGSASGWTAASTKGFGGALLLVYGLN